MIASIKGQVTEKYDGQLVLEVQGIGYSILMTNEDVSSTDTNQSAKVYIYEYIRESSHDLFGFSDPETKQLFERLIEVNGVGPKMALSILNVGNVKDVKQAIAGGDTRLIQSASGVGKRIAERIVVELKDKVGLPSTDLESSGILQGESSLLKDDAALALVSLGYSPYDATQALRDVSKDLSTEERVRLALKGGKK